MAPRTSQWLTKLAWDRVRRAWRGYDRGALAGRPRLVQVGGTSPPLRVAQVRRDFPHDSDQELVGISVGPAWVIHIVSCCVNCSVVCAVHFHTSLDAGETSPRVLPVRAVFFLALRCQGVLAGRVRVVQVGGAPPHLNWTLGECPLCSLVTARVANWSN